MLYEVYDIDTICIYLCMYNVFFYIIYCQFFRGIQLPSFFFIIFVSFSEDLNNLRRSGISLNRPECDCYHIDVARVCVFIYYNVQTRHYAIIPAYTKCTVSNENCINILFIYGLIC